MNDVEALVEAFARRLDETSVVFGHGAADARGEAELLVHGFLDGRAWNAEASASLHALLERRIDERIPVAYLTGKAWFAGRWFAVDRGVMIPRSPLAELIGNGFHPWLRREPGAVLDLCCGVGCLGIATALQFPRARVVLADIDDAAIAGARANVARFGLGGRVEVRKSSLVDDLAPQTFDLVLANPPYVPAGEVEELPPEYRYEPRRGLESGADGLDCWRRILGVIGHWLHPHGLLVGEAGNTATALRRAFPASSFIWPDLVRATRLEDGSFGVFVLDAAGLSIRH